jgi:hypothetical protein
MATATTTDDAEWKGYSDVTAREKKVKPIVVVENQNKMIQICFFKQKPILNHHSSIFFFFFFSTHETSLLFY